MPPHSRAGSRTRPYAEAHAKHEQQHAQGSDELDLSSDHSRLLLFASITHKHPSPRLRLPPPFRCQFRRCPPAAALLTSRDDHARHSCAAGVRRASPSECTQALLRSCLARAAADARGDFARIGIRLAFRRGTCSNARDAAQGKTATFFFIMTLQEFCSVCQSEEAKGARQRVGWGQQRRRAAGGYHPPQGISISISISIIIMHYHQRQQQSQSPGAAASQSFAAYCTPSRHSTCTI